MLVSKKGLGILPERGGYNRSEIRTNRPDFSVDATYQLVQRHRGLREQR